MVNKQDDKMLQIAAELKTNSQSMQIKCGSIYANHWINLKQSDFNVTRLYPAGKGILFCLYNFLSFLLVLAILVQQVKPNKQVK